MDSFEEPLLEYQNLRNSKNIAIVDSTLREGLQAPGVHFSTEQSVEIATFLEMIGVDVIECGHPHISAQELHKVRSVIKAVPKTEILSHARAFQEDIRAVAASGAKWAGIFLGVNKISRRARVQRDKENLIGMIKASVAFAKSEKLNVRYTVEDASRTELHDLIDAYSVALEAGADRICFADTVGCSEPNDIKLAISALSKKFPRTPIEMHLHDDRGLAHANALAAMDAGATFISTSTNGLGERCGITDTIQLIGSLHARGIRKLKNPQALYHLARLVSALSREPIPRMRPIVGEAAFSHTAKLHRNAVDRDDLAYSWIEPSVVGRFNTTTPKNLPRDPGQWMIKPEIISATELKYHRKGPGDRYVMIDERYLEDCRQYCIVRHVPKLNDYGQGHVDEHKHTVDSLFLFLGYDENLTGFHVEVRLEGKTLPIESPASVFIPSGSAHSYRVVKGPGIFVNHVLAGNYNQSLLDNFQGNTDETG